MYFQYTSKRLSQPKLFFLCQRIAREKINFPFLSHYIGSMQLVPQMERSIDRSIISRSVTETRDINGAISVLNLECHIHKFAGYLTPKTRT